MEKCQSNASPLNEIPLHGILQWMISAKLTLLEHIYCVVQCDGMLGYCIMCVSDSDTQVPFKNLYQVNSQRWELQFRTTEITNWMGGTGHCKIQDLSVGQKEVWGKLAKCYREEGKSENTICNMKLFGQGIYCLLSQRQHVEGRKEKSKKWLFWEDQSVQGSIAIHYSRGTGWSVRVSWPASRYCLEQN